MGLLKMFFGDREAERSHKERMAQISADTQMTMNRQDNNAKKFSSVCDNAGRIGEAFFTGGKKN